ncbi:peptide/nickel transport system permease protein [Amycolatopsis pretoriensis]|uniref:Peptide/nickel transport system permease protein n=1 Tax=Amycolatopsis pretoriensis TaxID=218821 RepID=A0A1H5Q388_9PSEU|nr:ABC transporter permease [Amycolatopsis pretoriensis]SEF19898.1 peptide/nickel transport system permease protein [Amycolatopsis pretoriensis]
MRTARFVATRFAGMLLVLFVVAFVTFVVFYVLPADPARLACGRPCSPEGLRLAREFMGYDVPWYQQFFDFLGGIFGGRTFGTGAAAVHCTAPCFGWDFQNNVDVLSEIGGRIEVSFSVALGAAAIWIVLGVGLGVLSALRRGTAVDRITMAAAMTGVSMPAYLAGMIGITIFAFALDVVPKNGYVPLTEDPAQWAWHLVLPWFVLAFLHAAIYARLTRGQMLETLGEDYIRTARAKGLTERKVVGRHALRNVLLPVITVFGVDLGGLLAGTVITERIFGMAGVGRLLVDAIASLNLPVLLGVTLFSALLVTVLNFLVDLCYGALDPRARLV